MARLPNLNALRVLTEVARSGSFSAAAQALGVTQSAVSKQIAGLEDHFGQKLFQRFHRRVEITAFGRQVADRAAEAFAHLQAGLPDRPDRAPNQIRLWGDADFVELWLFPRLRRFEAEHPDIRISISVAVGMNRPPEQPFDCAVIWGRGDWTGCRFSALMTNTVFPVAAPGYFRDTARRPRLSDVPEGHLIHDQTTFWWRAFREAAGERGPNAQAGRIYNRTSLCLEATARGDGVTIGDEVTTRRHLEEGILLCPFDLRLPSPDAYYILEPEDAPSAGPTADFLRWLRAEAEDHARFFRQFWRRQG